MALELEPGIAVAHCRDCGFLVYARSLEDVKHLTSKHDKRHEVSVGLVAGFDVRKDPFAPSLIERVRREKQEDSVHAYKYHRV